MSGFDYLRKFLVSGLLALFPTLVLVAMFYMGIHDFGERFLNVEREHAFWMGSLTLYLTLTALIFLIWTTTKEQSHSS